MTTSSNGNGDGKDNARAPAAYRLDDPDLKAASPRQAEDTEENLQPTSFKATAAKPGWGGLFLSALAGLAVLALTLWVEGLVSQLVARQDWLGWLAVALAALAGFALFMMIAREAISLLRLSAMTALRQQAETALHQGSLAYSRAVAKAIRARLKDKPLLQYNLRKLQSHDADVLDAQQVLALTERELLRPLDTLARAAIASSARRVSVVTAISPAALVDVGFVAYENFRLLRTLAGLYGGRPGFFATLRLLRLVAANLAITGGLAVTEDFMQQVLGQGLTARLSRKLGEGIINGAFTIRLGIAALEVLRPLPYIETRPPRLRDFLSEIARVRAESDAPKG
jgi:putative membrane protein